MINRRDVKLLLRITGGIIGVVLEFLAIIAGLAVPFVFTITIPIIKAFEYYASGGDGIAVIAKTALVAIVLTPLLSVVIFTPLFISGAMLYMLCEETKPPQRPIQVEPIPEQPINPMMDGLFIDDSPHDSNEGIEELNQRLSHPEQFNQSKEEEQ